MSSKPNEPSGGSDDITADEEIGTRDSFTLVVAVSLGLVSIPLFFMLGEGGVTDHPIMVSGTMILIGCVVLLYDLSKPMIVLLLSPKNCASFILGSIIVSGFGMHRFSDFSVSWLESLGVTGDIMFFVGVFVGYSFMAQLLVRVEYEEIEEQRSSSTPEYGYNDEWEQQNLE